MRTLSLRWLASLLPVLSLSACEGWNHVETGAYGVLTFTPNDCGRAAGCDLDVPIVVGGRAQLDLDTVDDHADVEGITLIASAPWVLDVVPRTTGALWSEWDLIGTDAGWTDLIAIDKFGYEVDYVTVEVRRPEALALEPAYGDAVGPTSDREGYAEVWTVNAGAEVAFDVRPWRGARELMGRVEYDVVIDELLLAALTPDARLVEGYLAFRIAAGEYPVRFVAPDGTVLDVLIVAR